MYIPDSVFFGLQSLEWFSNSPMIDMSFVEIMLVDFVECALDEKTLDLIH